MTRPIYAAKAISFDNACAFIAAHHRQENLMGSHIQKENIMTADMQTIIIKSINTKPEHDPYTRIDGVSSRTVLKLDCRDRTVRVTQEYQDNSMFMTEYNRLVLTWQVNGYPTEADMRQWITDNLESLATICDGFEEHWNGNNMIGRYTEEARAADQGIEYQLDNDGGPVTHYGFWSVESWLEYSRDEITADMTDEQLAEFANGCEPGGEIVVDGSILDFITKIRDTLLSESTTDDDQE